MTTAPRSGRLRAYALGGACALALLLGLVAPAQAADPLVVQQDWLARVVPAGLPVPSGPIPPIAIIEAGFDETHPEMQGGWVALRRPSPRPDLNDPAAVERFVARIAHGTAVASVIGAPRDGIGMEGVLPGAQVRVYGSSALCRDVAAAIRLAVRDGARVINASYGFSGPGLCLAHENATSFAFGSGAIVVAAAGNQRVQPWIQPGNDYHVLTVAALNAFDQPTGFSHQNVNTDIAAPGEAIFLASPSWWDTTDGVADGYERADGTSFSAPMVSAAAAWVMAERPALNADQVAEILRRSARDVQRPGWDVSTGWGALDLAAALREPVPLDDPLEPNDDIRWVDGRAGFKPDVPLLRRRTSTRLSARLDLLKDPADVYPVWVPARTRLVVTLEPSGMPMDLYVWPPGATSAFGRGVVAKSRRLGLATDNVSVVNSGPRGLKAWVEVRAVRASALAGVYTLKLRR